uniref:C2 domain-containing protein n=1 Tax=Erythrolobus madagascarensis TaxID=708628 RepID=A0A7S0T9U4_9RHOD|mmetsp:Transcript_3582/g.7825  ORF Transcript_3582/g.7825 Transcript_3582/m.7825 type:complete len:372 (+) Transcript_3582:58-1173(+)
MADFFRSSLRKPTSTAVLELSVSLRNLINMDVFSKSDPFVVFYIRGDNAWTTSDLQNSMHLASSSFSASSATDDISHIPHDGAWIPAAVTETVWDNLNPDFVTKLRLPWKASSSTKSDKIAVRLSVFDRDTEGDVALSKHDFIGNAEFKLQDVLSSNNNNNTIRLQLVNLKGKARSVVGKTFGSAVVYGEVIEDFGDSAHALSFEFGFKFSCPLPAKKGFFYTIARGKSGVRRKSDVRKDDGVLNDDFVRVHRSGVLLRPSDGKPDDVLFQTVKLSDAELFGNDEERLLRVELWENKKSGAHDRLLCIETSVKELMAFDETRDELEVRMTSTKSLARASVAVVASAWTLSSKQLGSVSLRLLNLAWAKGYL